MSAKDLSEPSCSGQPNSTRLLYSYSEARELLGGVPVSTFAGWIAAGLLKPVRIGPRRCFIRHEDLVAISEGIDLH